MEIRRITICHECLAAFRQHPHASYIRRLAPPAKQEWTGRRGISARAHNERLRAQRTTPQPQKPANVLESLMIAARSAHTVSSQDLNALHLRINSLTESALKPEDGKLPEEQRVLYVLEQLEDLAKQLIDGHTISTTTPTSNTSAPSQTATSALLGSVNARSYPAFITQASLLNLISEKAESLLRHPTVFITPAILALYTTLQALLHQPTSFPAIFQLYAHKPIPHLSHSNNNQPTITYTPASPTKISAAVPSSTANTALTAAITSHNLPLAIDIITTTYCTPAYRSSKLLRQALVPLTGLGITPIAAYALSQTFASSQTTIGSLDHSSATWIAFSGIMAYVAAVSGMGYVAITTANDQMDRVTWAAGVPLWERWIREEERAAIDRVAGKWGFQERERRGEEEGVEWEELREFVGVRGMVLDRAELMEGME